MDFPRFVFRSPGSLVVDGGDVSQSLCEDNKQRTALLADGWHDSIPDALADYVADDQEEDAPPTRDEMLEQAAELGITVDKRWSDKTLLAKITEAL
jgi:hypothetical protein